MKDGAPDGVDGPVAIGPHPGKYKVVVLRDEYTSLTFAVAVLMQVFSLTLPSALSLAARIHEDGRATAGVYSAQTAETKTWVANTVARHEGHPLLFVMEKA